MGAFADPFYGNVPDRKMTVSELIRALRLNIAAEEEATALYEAHADATDNPIAKKVLLDVANEERVHVGEFIELINILTRCEEEAWIANGAVEVREMAEEVARGDLNPANPFEKAEKESPECINELTVGSLKP
ncbi:MAG: ferritin family protein [Armatimonadota bacterium]|nr:Rubrerythrin [bacterium]